MGSSRIYADAQVPEKTNQSNCPVGGVWVVQEQHMEVRLPQRPSQHYPPHVTTQSPGQDFQTHFRIPLAWWKVLTWQECSHDGCFAEFSSSEKLMWLNWVGEWESGSNCWFSEGGLLCLGCSFLPLSSFYIGVILESLHPKSDSLDSHL